MASSTIPLKNVLPIADGLPHFYAAVSAMLPSDDAGFNAA
jgi:hypothetical protein